MSLKIRLFHVKRRDASPKSKLNLVKLLIIGANWQKFSVLATL